MRTWYRPAVAGRERTHTQCDSDAGRAPCRCTVTQPRRIVHARAATKLRLRTSRNHRGPQPGRSVETSSRPIVGELAPSFELLSYANRSGILLALDARHLGGDLRSLVIGQDLRGNGTSAGPSPKSLGADAARFKAKSD